MLKVNLFNDDVILDKRIVVTLDGAFKDDYAVYANNLIDLRKCLDRREDFIITPLTCAVSSWYMEKGYDIIVQNGRKIIRFSKLLGYDNNGEKSFGREIRDTQNWEKMLYVGCFDIDMPEGL